MNTYPDTLLPSALAYAERGWAVLPLHRPCLDTSSALFCSCGAPTCKSIGKHPMTLHGLHDATTDRLIVEQWWASKPLANIGVTTGAQSGFIAIDVDPRHEGEDSMLQLMEALGDLPPTITAHTGGGGFHLLFRHPGKQIKNRTGIAPGVDIRGDGGYIVVAPSLHSSGQHYRWMDEHDPQTIALADLPSKWFEWFNAPKSKRLTVAGASTNPTAPIPEGQRNDTLTRIAGSLYAKKLSDEDVIARLLIVNSMRCVPPLDETEVRRIAESIGKRERESRASDKKPSRTLAEIADDLFADVTLFHTSGAGDSEAFARVRTPRRWEVFSVRSRAFSQFLMHRFFAELERAMSAHELTDMVNHLAAKAICTGPEHEVGLRIGQHENRVYWDLADSAGQVVEVTADGWNIIEGEHSPVWFTRPTGMLGLPVPVRGGSVEELRPLVNVPDDESWMLLVGWLVMCLCPNGPYPLLAVNGEQGSAKSSLCRFVRSLIDPNKAPVRRPPTNERDLFVAACRSRMLAFDNLSYMKADLSDSLCGLATGTGISTRELYTDDGEKILQAMRPVIINGIEDLMTRSDLASRAVHLTLPVISASHRTTEKVLEAQFEAIRPRVMGALLDAAACALRRRNDVHLDELPRMADFAVWVTAAEPSFGWTPGAFVEAIKSNSKSFSASALESVLIGPPLLKLLSRQPQWSGTAAELLRSLEPFAEFSLRSAPGWPRTPRAIGGALRRIAPNLREQGFTVEMEPEGTGNDRKRVIRLTAPTSAQGVSAPSRGLLGTVGTIGTVGQPSAQQA